MRESISQVLTFGYGHHIQRLMVTGLFSLLWGVKPDQIHRWYLGMYIDAVAWVEIPNTIGMSQYADGGIVGSKPYIASGAYIKRMSNYCDHCQFKPKQASGDKACPFTTLYWSFIDKHRDLLSRNPRLGMQVRNWDNKGNDEQQAIRDRSEWLYQHLDQSGYKEQG
jgi:deoxyribodipyrimidine photolyase-related protein